MKNSAFTIAALCGSLLLNACNDQVSVTPLGSDTTYQPLTKGSKWIYKYTPNSLLLPDNHIITTNTMTGVTSSSDNITYYQMSVVSDNGLNYFSDFSLSNHIYYTKGHDKIYNMDLSYPYLIDNKPVGYTWTSPVTLPQQFGNITTAEISGQIMEEGIDKTVSTITYHNVIHSQVTLQYKTPNSDQWLRLLVIDYYAAKGTGIIAMSESGGVDSVLETELTSASIK